MAGSHEPTKLAENLPNNTPLGNITNCAWHMKKNGRAQSTIETATRRLRRLAQLCDINNPEEVKEAIAKQEWQNSSKKTVANLYTGYLTYIGKTWTKPTYSITRKLPFIPTEEELDTLINAGSPKTAVLLQILKETGARIGEIAITKWHDIDFQRRTINITAEKGSNSRILPLTVKTINMINNLPRKTDSTFQVCKHSLRITFESLRKRTAKKLQNPRLRHIHFHTFRHWKGTMEYHKTKDIIHVKTILGHKSIESTMLYINLESALYLSNSDEWTSKTASTIKEAQELIDAGFEHVVEMNNIQIFRKRK